MAFLDGVLNPLLSITPVLLIPLLSLFLTLLITMIYKWTTNQELMKKLKDDMKKLQKEVKELQQHPEKMMEKNKEMMDKNMKYMMHSMKSTLYTFIPLILIFGWMNAHFTYDPIAPGEQFTVIAETLNDQADTVSILEADGIEILSNDTVELEDKKATFTLKSKSSGSYIIPFDYGGKQFTKRVMISEKFGYYEEPLKLFKDEMRIEVQMERFHPFGDFSVFGWHPGWLGTYIIISIVSSTLLRKWLKVH